jgi:hypothetical protein
MARPIRNDVQTLLGRIFAKSIPEPNSGCHLWTAGLDNRGYAKIGIRDENGRPKTTHGHRLAWQLANGPVPPGLVVMHLCDVPCCVNVEHLTLGTQADNLQDMWAKGRARPGYTPSHLRTNAKLSWQTVDYIRSTKTPSKQLAKELGVSDVLIYLVRNGRAWKEPTP